MTREDYGGYFSVLRRIGGRCLDIGPALDGWLAEHPDAEPTLARQHTPGFCAPMPSIDGNPPVYRDRPFYNARLLERL